MIACCQSCKRPVSAKLWLSCSSYRDTTCSNSSLSCRRIRSTKGASKARRDHINGEIQNMRQLLPIRPEERERLSYLHSMAAICTFIRKSVIYPELQVDGSGPSLPCEDFLQALPGFIVAMTREGKLIYVSENVVDYLGYSMVDVLQRDTFYDMLDNADVQVVRSHLEAASVPGTERAFVCRMHASKPFRLRQDGSGCSMLVRGRFQTTPKSSQAPSGPRQTFIALCTPTVNRLRDGDAHSVLGHFQSVHRLDMSFRQMSDSVLFHLGYPVEELISQSWYGLLHPDDLRIGEAAHRRLLQEDKGVTVEMVLRLQHKDLSWVWLYVRAARDFGSSRQEVSCTNYVISEVEASFLRQKTSAAVPGALNLCPPHLPLSLGSVSPPGQGEGASRCRKRQREVAGLGEEPWAKRGALPFAEHANHTWDTNAPTPLRDNPVFPKTPPISPNSAHSLTTPPISPDSTYSPILTEGQSTDFSCSHAEDFLPPQGSSYPYPHCCGAHFCPPLLLQMVSDMLFFQSSLDMAGSQSPESCNDFSPCSTNARLVPHFLSETTADMAFHPEAFSLPAHSPAHPPGDASPFLPVHSTALLTPDPSPTTESAFLYSQEERAEISILDQQIFSLANSFHMYHSQRPAHRLNNALSPTLNPALCQTLNPALSPTLNPSLSLALNPALSPTLNPTLCPTLNPALSPTLNPALSPTLNPALCPTLNPALSPTLNPALCQTLNPALSPTLNPALCPTLNPALSPTLNPALSPTLNPALCPTLNPALSPTLNPALSPTLNPALCPTLNPALSPTLNPALSPTLNPALCLTLNPALSPTLNPALSPTLNPALCPTLNPALSPTLNPALSPTLNPALCPTLNPALNPTLNPALSPTLNPALSPTLNSALSRTLNPALSPTLNPALCPTLNPALSPTLNSALSPTLNPSLSLALNPALSPTLNPALCPTLNPALNPTLNPALSPTLNPALSPTLNPALSPTLNPALSPTLNPALSPTLNPALSPALNPALSPTLNPTLSPPLNPVHILNPTLSPAFSSTLNPAQSPTPIPTLSPILSPNPSLTLSLPSVSSKASSPSPPSQQTSLKPELNLDEDIIDYILKHLDQAPPYSRPSSTCPLAPPCGLEILEKQRPVVFITAQEDKLLTHPTLDPCALILGNSNELYQLSQYPPASSLQQDGLVEESMY